MSDDFQIRDTRPGFYWIDNEVYTKYGLSLVALAIYNDMACRANNSTQSAYFAANAFCKRFKVGKKTAQDAFRELMDHGLVRVTGRNERGCKVIELIQVRKGGSQENRVEGVVLEETGVVLERTGGGSQENTNKTDKQHELKTEEEPTHLPKEIVQAVKDFNAATGQFVTPGTVTEKALRLANGDAFGGDLSNVADAIRNYGTEYRPESSTYRHNLDRMLDDPAKVSKWAAARHQIKSEDHRPGEMWIDGTGWVPT